jgi:hypothetical protein
VSDILDTRADKPEQIPTDNSEPLTRSIMDRLGIKKNLLARCAISKSPRPLKRIYLPLPSRCPADRWPRRFGTALLTCDHY